MEEKEDEVADEPHLGQIMQEPPDQEAYNGDKDENTEKESERE